MCADDVEQNRSVWTEVDTEYWGGDIGIDIDEVTVHLGETDGEYYLAFPNTEQPGEQVYCHSDTYRVGVVGERDWFR